MTTTEPPTKIDPASLGLAASVPTTRIVRKQTITEFGRHLARMAIRAETPPIVLVALKDSDEVRQQARRKLAAIAERSPLVAIFGKDLPSDLAPASGRCSLTPTIHWHTSRPCWCSAPTPPRRSSRASGRIPRAARAVTTIGATKCRSPSIAPGSPRWHGSCLTASLETFCCPGHPRYSTSPYSSNQ